MIAVLDSNVLIASIFWRGNCYSIVLSALKKEFTLCLSEEIIAEVEEKLRIKFNFPEDMVSSHIAVLRHYFKIVTPRQKLSVVKDDPKDDKFIEAAVEGKCDFIVSGDKKHLLKLKEYKGTKIVSPKEFLDILNKRRENL